jgi:hypothetical protein
MVYFTRIVPSSHYLAEHADEVPWEMVVEIILTSKCPRKRSNKYQIETDEHYVLFEIRDQVLIVINAKRK